MLSIVLMGGPGAGKGTQARRLSKTFGLPQISTGELLRKNVKDETEYGLAARRYMDRGELVPDVITVPMVRERLQEPDCAAGVLFDGFPRTIEQADALNELLAERDARIDVVPYINVSPEALLQRLSGRWTCKKCGHVYHVIFDPPKVAGICDFDGSPLYQREDDTEETQKRRIEIYFKETRPLLDYYRDRDLLVEINGEQSIDEVYEDLAAVIHYIADRERNR